jgi:hypothetical protein
MNNMLNQYYCPKVQSNNIIDQKKIQTYHLIFCNFKLPIHICKFFDKLYQFYYKIRQFEDGINLNSILIFWFVNYNILFLFNNNLIMYKFNIYRFINITFLLFTKNFLVIVQ